MYVVSSMNTSTIKDMTIRTVEEVEQLLPLDSTDVNMHRVTCALH